MKESAVKVAQRLALGETINRVDMPDMKLVLLNLEEIERNVKCCIKQLKKNL
jgi:hypothetical protein